VTADVVLLLLALRARGRRPWAAAEQSHPHSPASGAPRTPVRSRRADDQSPSMTSGRERPFPRDAPPITGRTRQERARAG
jgi:hypothetical protein